MKPGSAGRREFRSGTIDGIFRETVALFPDKTALMFKDRDGAFRTMTYAELHRTVARTADWLRGTGVARGDRIAICAYHGPDWVIADLAALSLGAIVVPIYHTLSAPSVRHILRDSGASLVFAEDARVLDIVSAIRRDLPGLRTVAVFGHAGPEGRGDFTSFDDVKSGRERGGAAPAGSATPGPAETRPEDTATIVYTSGTTAEPKGVVLTHANVVYNTLTGIARFDITPEDMCLSFLPMCHMLERIAGYYSPIFAGATIAYGGGIPTIADDVLRVRPTHITLVPRVLEKAYEAVARQVAASHPIRRRMVSAAINRLNRRANLSYKGERIPVLLELQCRFYDRFVASRFRRLAGGRLRLLVSGGAPLDKNLAKLLWILGLNIVQGYGLTEASLAVSTTTLEDNRLDTVGKPYPGTEVTIGPNDEILVRGPGVMKGYYNLPDDTAAAIDAKGWLHTGDQGRFDERGNLVITGRIKELIVTSYGKNIAPVPIEYEIARSPYVEQVMVCGDRQKYLTALVVPARSAMERFAGDRQLAADDYPSLLQREEVRELIAAEIGRATEACSSYEKIKGFILVPEPFTTENDMLTPTLKMRRSRIEEKYASEIDSMYARG
ncbi:MAG: long-chain fatty acid--CoA ligase [bacterium]